MMTQRFIGYHGTDQNNQESIQKEGFRPSTKKTEWLGDGVYFFIEGISDPQKLAENWAIASAYDKTISGYRYHKYCILQATIEGDRVADLRIEEDLKLYNQFRDTVIELYRTEKKNSDNTKRFAHPDTWMCNLFCKQTKIDIFINNFYIKDPIQRRQRENSRIANATVLCAKEKAQIKEILCKKHDNITGDNND